MRRAIKAAFILYAALCVAMTAAAIDAAAFMRDNPTPEEQDIPDVPLPQRTYVPPRISEERERDTPPDEEVFTVTAYCPCVICCGTWSADHPSRVGTEYVQRTASGTIPVEGQTAGADWSILPSGTVIYIEGLGQRVIEDHGTYGGKILDIYFDSHEDAVQFGRQKMAVRPFQLLER